MSDALTYRPFAVLSKTYQELLRSVYDDRFEDISAEKWDEWRERVAAYYGTTPDKIWPDKQKGTGE